MMPAVGNVPERGGPGVSASTARMGGSSVNDGDGSGSGSEFGSAMTAAFANHSQQHASVSGQQTTSSQEASKPQAQRSGMDSSKSAAQSSASSRSSEAAAGKQAARTASVDSQSKSGTASATAETAGKPPSTAAGAAAGVDGALSGLAAPGGSTAQAAVAGKGEDSGVQRPNTEVPGVANAVSVEPVPDENATSDLQTETTATAGKGTKDDPKKAESKDAGAEQVLPLPNGIAVAATPAPTVQGVVPAVKTAAGSQGAAKGDGGATPAAAGRSTVTAAMMVAATVSGAKVPPGTVAVSGASLETDAGKSSARAPVGNPGSSGEIAADKGGAQSAVQRAAQGAASGTAANADAGQTAGTISANGGTDSASTQSTGSQSTGVQSAVVQSAGTQGAVGATPSQAQRLAASGTVTAGNSVSNGFTATLLNGQPTMASAAQPTVHIAAGASGAPGSVNPYARMDDTHGASLVYASSQKMSVAVSDPSLGSFQVRAQSTGAQVAASLATASSTTHAQLSGQLPSLTAFLQEQRVDLSRVTVMQQSMLGGDSGARNSGGQQQGRSGSSASSRSWGARSRRVGSVGSAELASGVNAASSATGPRADDDVAVEAASAGSVQQRDDSGVSYVDVLA